MVWAVSKLGEVCNIVGGGTPSKSNEDFYGGEIPWATVRDMREELLSSTELKITEEAIKKSSTNLIPSGSIITATRVGLGKVCILQQDTAINQDLKAIIPNVGILDNGFLYWWLKSVSHEIVTAGTGATVQGVKLTFIKLLEIPLPPIAEQKRIVAILDKAFADIDRARAIAEQNLKNARELFDSYLQQVFSQRGEGWVDYQMADICNITSKLVDPKKNEYLDLLHIGAGNIVSNTGELVDVKTAREEGLISGKFVFDDSMILYSKIRPYLMKVCRPTFIGLCSADIYPLAPIDGKIEKDYLFYLLLSKDFTDYAISGSGRAGMPKVNRNHLFSYPVTLPTIDKQRIYVEKINQISEQSQALENLYCKKLTELDSLKKSILQKAFSGELTKDDTGAAA